MSWYPDLTFGERLAYVRELRGFTQQQLAEKMDVHPSLISQFECMARLPSYGTLKQLCLSLQTSGDWLLGLSDVIKESAAPSPLAARRSKG